MELGSSKHTRPTNKEYSLTNPQSTYKLDGTAIQMKDIKDICRMSPDQNFGSGLNHQFNHHGI